MGSSLDSSFKGMQGKGVLHIAWASITGIALEERGSRVVEGRASRHHQLALGHTGELTLSLSEALGGSFTVWEGMRHGCVWTGGFLFGVGWDHLWEAGRGGRMGWSEGGASESGMDDSCAGLWWVCW